VNSSILGVLPEVTYFGNNVASNASDNFQVLTLETPGSEFTSVIVPAANFPSGMSFNSTSYGMGVICGDVPSNFTTALNQSTPLGLFAIQGAVLPNSSVSFTMNFSNFPDQSFATYNLQDSQGNVPELNVSGVNVTNPFGIAYFTQWRYGVTSTGSQQGLQETPIHVWGVCNISVYDVELSYTNGTYNLTNRTLSMQNTTTMLFLPFLNPYFSDFFAPRWLLNLASTINPADVNDPNRSLELFHQISQLGIGLNAGLFMPTQTSSDIKIQKTLLASRYPVNALGLLWASTVLYIIFGTGILIQAANEEGECLPIEPVAKSLTSDSGAHSVSTTSTLALAQQWITSPSAIIAEHFVPSTSIGHKSNLNVLAQTLSVPKSTADMFGDESGTDRLGIGFQNPGQGEGLNRRGKFYVGYRDHFEAEAKE
jgi:hypothetical protein